MRSFVFASLLTALLVVFAPSARAEESTTTWKPNAPLIAGGLAGAGAAYGATAWFGSRDCTYLDHFCEEHRKELLVPFAGPLIHAVNLAAHPLPGESDLVVDPITLVFGARGFRWFEVAVLTLDSIVQTAGVGVALYGAFARAPAKPPSQRASTTRITPMIGLSQLGLQGTF